MDKKLNIKLGFILIPFAFIFLFEPFYMLSDPLPDVIGYLILYCSLISLADVNHKIRKALGNFKIAIVISICRFVSKGVWEKLFSETESSTGLLLFIFVLSLFEIITLVPAYKNLFEGLLSLALMHNGESVYYKKTKKALKIDNISGEKILVIRESQNNVTEKLSFLTIFFCITKSLLVLLPELTSLATNEDYEFIGVIRILAFFALLPLGIYWLIKIFKYFVSIRKDKAFIENLTDLRSKTLLLNPKIYDARVLSTGLYILIAAFILSIDLYSDHVNVIHNSLFYIAAIFAALVLSKFSKKWILLLSCSAVGAIVSYITHQLNSTLYSDPNFYAGAAKKNVQVYYSFYKMAFFSLADAICLLITVIIAVMFLFDIYKKFSRYPLLNDAQIKKEYVFGLWAFTIVALCFTTLSCAAYVYYIFTQPQEGLGLWYFSYASLINIAISIASAIAATSLILFIKGRVESRYSLDL